ncbi:MAG: hypothetical protein R3B99_10980 [Polyangiales bacterium]
MSRWAWLFAAIFALPVGLFGSALGGEHLSPPPVDAGVTGETTEAMLDALRALGAVENTREEADALPVRRTLPLPLGACVSVIAIAHTSYPVVARFVGPSGEKWVDGAEGWVSGVSICSTPETTSVDLVVETGPVGRFQREGTPNLVDRVELIVLGGGDFDAATLPLGVPNPAWTSKATAAACYAHHRARLGNDDDGALSIELAAQRWSDDGPELATGAWLMPRSPTTIAWSEAAVAFARAVDAEVRTNEDVLLWRGPNATHRVLAVIDPGDLPFSGEAQVPCARLELARMARPTGPIARVTDLAAEPTPLEEARDRFCPGDPPRLYVVPASDDAFYRLSLHAQSETGPRQVGARPTIGEHARLRAARAACEANPVACEELGRLLHHGTLGVRDPVGATEAFTRACDATRVVPDAAGRALATSQRTRVCLQLVAQLESVGPSVAFGWLKARCDDPHESNRGAFCAALGDRYRLGRGTEFDLVAARAAYRRGCEAGDPSACHNLQALDLMQL